MTPRRTRLSERLAAARRFASQAHGVMDYAPLFLAGVARHRPFGDDSLYSRLGRILGREVRPRIRSANGCRVHLRLNEAVDLMVFEEVFLDRIYPLEAIPFVPEIVIDAGACTGLFSLLARAQFPEAELIAVEPHPDNFRWLTRHLRENGIEATCHEAAISTVPGRQSFGGSGFGGALASVGAAGTFSVEGLAVEDLLAGVAHRALLLKIDIEGAEKEVLPRMLPLLPPACAICLETHHPENICATYLAPFEQAGFQASVVRRRPAPAPVEEYVEWLLLRTR